MWFYTDASYLTNTGWSKYAAKAQLYYHFTCDPSEIPEQVSDRPDEGKLPEAGISNKMGLLMVDNLRVGTLYGWGHTSKESVGS